jgi:cytochrome c
VIGRGCAAVVLALALSLGASAAERLCGTCHAIPGIATPSGPLQGPTLVGLRGRKAGSLADFDYSEAMREAGRAGLVWDEATLRRYVEEPQAVVPGTFMAAPIFRDATERDAVLRQVLAPRAP